MPKNSGLAVEVGITLNKLTKQLAKAEARMVKTTNKMETSFSKANGNSARSFRKLDRAAARSEKTIGASFGRIRNVAAAVLSGLGVRQVARYADAWTSAGNKIKAASQVSGIQARSLSDLNDIATKSRAGLTETVDLYARILRASGPLGRSELEVAAATEIVAKAFKAGGASAQEQAAGILQLGQALGSGFLQGDELRSIRENSPLIAQAIADEFKTTIGGLKKLGADGLLVSDRVLDAILKGKAKIDAAYATTDKTIGEGFTLAKNSLIELVGAFNDGANASAGIGDGLANISTYLQSSTDAAERFGAQSAEALEVIGEGIDYVSGLMDRLGDETGVSMADVQSAIGGHFDIILEGLKIIIATASAAGAGIGQGMLSVVSAVGNGGVAIANGAISAVESIINGIIGGIQKAVTALNNLISKANAINPLGDIPTLTIPLKVELERFEGGFGADNIGVADAFKNEFARVKGILDEGEQAVKDTFQRIKTADGLLNSGYEADEFVNSLPTDPEKPNKRTTTSSGSGKGKTKDKLADFFANIEAQKQALRDEIDLIGLSQEAIVRLEAKQQLLAAAKKKGLDLDVRSKETGQTVREEIDAQAEAIGRLITKHQSLNDQNEFWNDQIDSLKDGLVDAIVEGESFEGVLADIAKSIAKAALQAALFNEGPLKDLFGGGGGLLSGLFGGGGGGKGLFSGSFTAGFDEGGYTGDGGKMQPKGVVHGGEYVFSKAATQKAGVGNLDALHKQLKGFSSGGFVGSTPPSITTPNGRRMGSGGTSVIQVLLSPELEARVLKKAAGQSVEVVSQGMSQMRQEVPGILEKHQKEFG